LSISFPSLVFPAVTFDALGPYAITGLDIEPLAAKRRCIVLEASHPAARLIDLDIYSAAGIQVDRACLDLPRRTCLLCSQPAVECIRAKRHSLDQVVRKVHALLAYFSA
jgi:holo-ACP synthase CitX